MGLKVTDFSINPELGAVSGYSERMQTWVARFTVLVQGCFKQLSLRSKSGEEGHQDQLGADRLGKYRRTQRFPGVVKSSSAGATEEMKGTEVSRQRRTSKS